MIKFLHNIFKGKKKSNITIKQLTTSDSIIDIPFIKTQSINNLTDININEAFGPNIQISEIVDEQKINLSQIEIDEIIKSIDCFESMDNIIVPHIEKISHFKKLLKKQFYNDNSNKTQLE